MSGKLRRLSDWIIRHTTKLILEALAVVAGGVTILAIALAIRLSQGPIPIDFLTPTIAQALKGLSPDADVKVGETVLIWSRAGENLEVRAREVRVRGPNGEEWASVPELSVGLSLPALLHGVLAPSRLDIYGLHLRLVRTKEGAVQFGDTAQRPPPGAVVLPEGVAVGNAAEAGGPWLSAEAQERIVGLLTGTSDVGTRASYLRRVSMIDAEFVLDDRKTGHVWRAPEAHLVVTRDRNGTTGRATLAVEIGGEPTNLDVALRYRRGDPTLAVDAGLTRLDPAALAKAIAEPIVTPLGALEAPLSGEAHAEIGLDGDVRSVSFALDAGAGQMDYSRLGFGAGQPPLPIEGAHLRAHLTDSLDRLAVDSLELDLDDAKIALTGEADIAAAVPKGHIEVRTQELAVKTLIRYWPVGAIGHTREWLAPNLLSGSVHDVRIALDIGPNADGDLDVVSADGTFSFQDVAVAFFRPLPVAENLSGSATLKTDSLTVSINSGKVQDLAVSDGTVAVTGLSAHDQDLAVETVVKGPLRTALEILDSPRFGYAKKLGIDPSTAKGEVAARLRVTLPLIDQVMEEKLTIQANANLRGVTVPKAALGLDVANGALSLAVDRDGLTLKGNADVAGAPARFALEENFGDASGVRRRVYFDGTLDDAARQTAGISLAPEVTGPVAIETVVTDFVDHRTNIEAATDLGTATLSYPDFGLDKKAGVPATAALRATLRDGHLATIDDIEIKGQGLAASGRVAFGADGKTIAAARFPRIAFGETDVSVDAVQNPDGVLGVKVYGPKLDVEPLLSVKAEENKPVTPLTVEIGVSFARLGKGGGVVDLNGHLARDTRDWYEMAINGTLGPSKPLQIRMSRAGTKRPFSVTAADAGALVKALDISDNVVGGTLSLSGQYDDAVAHSPFKGALQVRNYRVVKAPLMARVLSVASLTGIVNVLSGNGIQFNVLDATLTFVNGAVYTDNLRAHGSALGFTGKGTIDLRAQTIDLEGTIVPAYSLNSVLGNIPILGSLLTGPQGGGVFAATYRVRGSLDDPSVSVNPLATLTPGFLRNLFDIFESAPPKTAPPPTAPAVPVPQATEPGSPPTSPAPTPSQTSPSQISPVAPPAAQKPAAPTAQPPAGGAPTGASKPPG
ncbi:MAG TPA: AsmA-like C-terminal domain-containing protein [Alphaproteobacteria bacterium]|nr:AsmA-like C-terminal domain-containing protein [Alphaproteobacteria bacterium]